MSSEVMECASMRHSYDGYSIFPTEVLIISGSSLFLELPHFLREIEGKTFVRYSKSRNDRSFTCEFAAKYLSTPFEARFIPYICHERKRMMVANEHSICRNTKHKPWVECHVWER